MGKLPNSGWSKVRNKKVNEVTILTPVTLSRLVSLFPMTKFVFDGIPKFSKITDAALGDNNQIQVKGHLSSAHRQWPMTPSTVLGTALEATGACLSVMATVAQISPVPYTQEVISLAESILSAIQRVRSNKAGFQLLAKDIRGLIRAVKESHVQSSAMKRRLKKLVSLLTEIKEFALEYTSHNVFHRIMTSSTDSSKMQDYRAQIRQALDVFEFRTQIDIHENTVKILNELRGRALDTGQQSSDVAPPDAADLSSSPETALSVEPVPSLPPAAVKNNFDTILMVPSEPNSEAAETDFTAPDSAVTEDNSRGKSSTSRSWRIGTKSTFPPSLDPTIPAPLPEGFRKNANGNPLLHAILGVATVFHDPPSVLQISLILGVQWTKVGATIQPIAPYFEHLESTINFNSDVKLRQALKDSVAGAVWLDAPKYHALVAKWCLTGKSPHARDIIYAGEFWSFHVCNAQPSTELYDSLRNSRLPLDPTSRSKLAEVIHWLGNGGAQAADLLATYRQQSKNPPQLVRIMGGMVNMLF
ncbi:hypothetical protein B0H14DRAFT_2624052 [Mycena olivaceomarginata]|nr:hypothetical protein B0H14DRAFT_2624052 [Mycena olivaceomarginata]